MVKKSDREVSSVVERKERKPVVTMVPLFSLRTMLIVAIGLIVGAGLGLGYWFMNPSLGFLGDQSESGGLRQYVAPPAPTTDVPWTSKVSIQVVNPGSSYMSMRDLQGQGEYYAAKANSLPFLEFLSQELDKQAPEYSHTTDELDQIMRVRYVSNVLNSRTTAINSESENPAIEMKVTSASAQEALFLAKFVPEAFQDYLIAEEINQQQQEYQDTLNRIEQVKMAIFEVDNEIAAFNPQVAASDDVNYNPRYVELSARVEALELELNRQAAELAVLTAAGETGAESEIDQEYQNTLEEMESVREALVETEQELTNLALQRAANDISNDPYYLVLKANIESLEFELQQQTAKLALLIAEYSTSQEDEDILAGIEEIHTKQEYKDILAGVERVSIVLGEAKNELSAMEAQASLDFAALDLDYQIAKAKVESLHGQLTDLTERLNRSRSGEQYFVKSERAFERTSEALAEARNELSILEAQICGPGGCSVEDLDYQIAQTKFENLNRELAGLTGKLSLLLGGNVKPAEITDCLVAGNPSMPTPVLPERMRARNALMMGAIVGIGGAWVSLNFRWIAKGMPRSSTPRRDEDEEE